MAVERLVSLVILTLLQVCYGDVCYYGYYNYYMNKQDSTYYFNSKYCSSGCCGYYYARDCCRDDTGTVIGGAIAGVSFVIFSFIIAIIIYKSCCGKIVRVTPLSIMQQTHTSDVTVNSAPHQNPMGYYHLGYIQPGSSRPIYGHQPAYPPEYTT